MSVLGPKKDRERKEEKDVPPNLLAPSSAPMSSQQPPGLIALSLAKTIEKKSARPGAVLLML